jgi:hypothetical protein
MNNSFAFFAFSEKTYFYANRSLDKVVKVSTPSTPESTPGFLTPGIDSELFGVDGVDTFNPLALFRDLVPAHGRVRMVWLARRF